MRGRLWSERAKVFGRQAEVIRAALLQIPSAQAGRLKRSITP
jgi:hypothetical protein